MCVFCLVVSNRRQRKHRHASQFFQAQVHSFTADYSSMGSPHAALLNRKISFSVGSSTGFRPIRKVFTGVPSPQVAVPSGISTCSSQHGCPGCHKLCRWLSVVEEDPGTSCVCGAGQPLSSSPQRPPCSSPSPHHCQHLATYGQYSAHWEYLLSPAPGWSCE